MGFHQGCEKRSLVVPCSADARYCMRVWLFVCFYKYGSNEIYLVWFQTGGWRISCNIGSTICNIVTYILSYYNSYTVILLLHIDFEYLFSSLSSARQTRKSNQKRSEIADGGREGHGRRSPLSDSFGGEGRWGIRDIPSQDLCNPSTNVWNMYLLRLRILYIYIYFMEGT